MDLGDRILSACKSRGLSLAAVCKKAGLRYSTLHSQIRNAREIPFSSVDRIAEALKLPLSHFSEHEGAPSPAHLPVVGSLESETARTLSELIAQQVETKSEAGYQVGTDDVLDWLTANNNRLQNHSWLIDRVNLYFPVGDNDVMVRPYHLGPKSLTSKYFQLTGIDDYATMFAGFDADQQIEILDAHRRAARQSYLVTDKRIDTLNEQGKRVTGAYRRLLAPVVTSGGQCLTMSFSKLTHFSTS